MDQQWLKSLKYYVKFRSVSYRFIYYMVLLLYYSHTGRLECFHNVLLVYAPKRSVFHNDFLLQYFVAFITNRLPFLVTVLLGGL